MGGQEQTLTPLRMPAKGGEGASSGGTREVGRWGALWPLFKGLCSVSAVSQCLFLLTCMRFGKQAAQSMQLQGDAGGRGRNTQCALRAPKRRGWARTHLGQSGVTAEEMACPTS